MQLIAHKVYNLKNNCFIVCNRIIICIVFMASSQMTKAQDNIPTPFEYRRVDSLVVGTKDELFIRASEWISLTFNSPGDFISYSNRGGGKIIVKCGFGMYNGLHGYAAITFTTTIDVKDNKTRIIITDFSQSYPQNVTYNQALSKSVESYSLMLDRPPVIGIGFRVSRREYDKSKSRVDERIRPILRDFKNYMRGGKQKISDGF